MAKIVKTVTREAVYHISPEELRELIKIHYNLPEDTTVSFETTDTSSWDDGFRGVTATFKEVEVV